MIVGRAGGKNESVFNLIKKLHLEKQVIFVGYVDDKDLPYFYNATRGFIYLSLYEGFGLPPLEAAKCKIPTLLYRNSSLKEIFPKNYPFAKRGNELIIVKELINDKSKINLSFVKNYSWKKYIKEFISLY